MGGFSTKHGQPKAIANSTARRQAMAQTYAQQVAEFILDCRQQGISYARIVDMLNQSDYSPPFGGGWHINQVQRILRLLRGQGGLYDRDTKRIFYLAKTYEEKKFADKFVNGYLHCKRLLWFKHTKNDYLDDSRVDMYEGVSQHLQPKNIQIVINNLDISRELAGPLTVQFDRFNYINLFCMHSGNSGNFTSLSNKNIKDLESFIKFTDRCKNFGDHTVIITDVPKFIRRVETACRNKGYKFHRKLVSYYDPQHFHGTFDGIEAVFMKREEYKDEREFRFAIDTGIMSTDPIDLYIGDIKDISMRCDIDEANKTLSLSLQD